MALAILVFAAMLVGYGVIPHEWLTFADSIMRWDDDHFVWHHGDLGGLLFFDFTKRALRDVVVIIIYGFVLTLERGDHGPVAAAAEGRRAAAGDRGCGDHRPPRRHLPLRPPALPEGLR